MPEALLPDGLLTAFRERAAGYDRENRFFKEDFAELVRIHRDVPARTRH